jgi:glycosyltransferase involved in cell wall biosynthesis
VALTKWLAKEELWKILGGADLFVLPSLREGMPNVMLEALGVDLPCIGSNIPGIQEILHHESLMFDPIDVNALAQKIIRFFSERDFAVLISQLCLERKQKFSFDWKAKVFEMITKRSSGV